MRPLLIIVFLILTGSTKTFSQKLNWLNTKLQDADTVLLVSHEATAGVVVGDSPKLIIARKPNYKIVKEQQILAGDKLGALIKILARPFQDTVIEMGKCFIPHHAIFIMRNGKTSYIDICFGCRRFKYSKDMQRL